MLMEGRGGPQNVQEGAQGPFSLDRQGSQIVTVAHGDWYEIARKGNLFNARAVVTAPVIYTTAAGTGGPLIWNPSGSGYNVSLLAVGFGVTVVTTVAAALGITGNTGQTSAPTSTTAIDSSGNCYIGGRPSASFVYRVGTPTNAGAFLMPFAQLHTGALTVDTDGTEWVQLNGGIIIPPGAWAAVAASATATTTVAQIGLMYEEIPL